MNQMNWMDKLIGWMGGWINRWIYLWADGWMDGLGRWTVQTDKWIYQMDGLDGLHELDRLGVWIFEQIY